MTKLNAVADVRLFLSQYLIIKKQAFSILKNVCFFVIFLICRNYK